MIRKLIGLYFTSMRLANTIDHVRLATDPGYREAVIGELTVERAVRSVQSPEAGKDQTADPARCAA